jgi:hypothetical protein
LGGSQDIKIGGENQNQVSAALSPIRTQIQADGMELPNKEENDGSGDCIE